ncbi:MULTISPECIES: YegS/Rv2252/BmrU family lipid kinase [unclassified Leifsonia]|uniref:YegS/Rv2252/BmrU family lipid kinase n=1 Tax=unclassified Leifsonia TaxID=2663824 RepID=UPI000A19951E|nr:MULTISPECIES: YegS/Rv2252/BmrU family lipid kinase [unclassified Leifsonia]QIZ98498.1 YegS/Rv2252/BmrU family lipid kinase [Leifsonia sp. PS1209]
MAASPRTVVVAVNPMASFGKRREVGPRVVERLRAAGHSVVALDEANVELLRREAKRAVAAGADALVVVGGDGMVNLGINIVAQTDIPLGIVPSGTGNDMADGLGIPVSDTEAAIALLLAALQKPPRRIDAGIVRHGGLSTWFGCVLSAGFDATVNERANLMTRPRGRSRYVLALLRELATLRPIPYRVVADGVPLDTDALLIAVANNRSIGGGMRVVPHASLDDGMLDLFVVRDMPKWRFLRLFPKVFSGTHTEIDEVSFLPARTVTIDAPDVVAYADGERIGPLPVEVSVSPGALLVLA